MISNHKAPRSSRVGAVDRWVGGVVLAFVIAISLFPIRNNDIWWHMAVGKLLLAGQRFIYQDPYLFSVPGAPWVPHAWLSGIIFYLVHHAFSTVGLVVFRALLVSTIVFLLLRCVKTLRISIALAAPFALLAVLNAHSRFILRPHLFEYLFILLLLGFLIAPRSRRGIRFYLFPVVLQLLWVNVHASFYLGPVMVLLFYVGEALSARLANLSEGLLAKQPIEWKRVGLLLLFMVAVTFINPSPLEFVAQPLGGEQRELLTQYTMEWRSPFDPALKRAAFHPYYEYLLAVAVLGFALAWKRLRLSSLLIVGFFAILSLQAHRFRVEFALVAVPLVLEQLSVAPLTRRIGERLLRTGRKTALVPLIFALALSGLLMFTARDRIVIEGSVSDRFPKDAFRFVRNEGIAQRPFHTIAFGSFLIWELYPDRQCFIDGRNFDATLYKDFLSGQTNSAGFNSTIRKYDIDAFILPVPERSDGGITNVHNFLIRSNGWTLVHIDRIAFVYVRDDTVPLAWLEQHAYRLYHPMVFAQLPSLPADVERTTAELTRARDEAPGYVRVLLDGGRFYGATGQRDRALEAIEEALRFEPTNAEALRLRTLLEALDGGNSGIDEG